MGLCPNGRASTFFWANRVRLYFEDKGVFVSGSGNHLFWVLLLVNFSVRAYFQLANR